MTVGNVCNDGNNGAVSSVGIDGIWTNKTLVVTLSVIIRMAKVTRVVTTIVLMLKLYEARM